ncbi:hypothetical protein AURDEDRAFT_167653 [Auricularia subglabra TFB-10046 SS5]|nr:hypothetical protein AURDEDRAFT_167653 [Auricularia subglabra TFB-10046 SS5]
MEVPTHGFAGVSGTSASMNHASKSRPTSLHSLPGDQHDPLGLFTPEFIEAYRAWAFPPVVHIEGSELHFSIYEPEKWTTLNGLCLFQRVCAGTIVESDSSQSSFSGGETPNVGSPALQLASMKLATAYKNFFLPPHLRDHPFFSLTCRYDWMSGAAFAAYLSDKSTRTASATPSVITVQGIPRVIKGSLRCAHGLSDPDYVIDIGDDDEVGDAMEVDFKPDELREAPGKRKRHSASV